MNVIAAKNKNQIIAPFLFECNCNYNIFEGFIEQIWCPVLKPGQVVITANATFHKSEKIKMLIKEKDCIIIHLPAYSPERNPIEKYWPLLKNKVKSIRKKIQDVYESVTIALSETQKFGQS